MKTVLVIDDDPGVLRGICKTLSRKGFRSVSASCCSEAGKLFRESAPDAVITDCTIGLYSDKNLFDEFLKMRPQTPVIVISGCFTDQEKIQCLFSGAQICLEKPFTGKKLIKALETCLARPRKT